MSRKLRLVVMGIMGRTPFAGVAWQVLHYVEGFRRLGHDVYYVEDTKTWPYNPETDANDCAYTVNYISRLMDWCGLPDRWAFRDVSQDNRPYGLSESQLSRLFKEADAIVNLTGSTWLHDEHLRVPVRLYLETDPGEPQIRVAKGQQNIINLLSAHTHHFTYAENIYAPDCQLPLGPFEYCPTRQPIILDWWVSKRNQTVSYECSDPCNFTTIASWQQSKDIEWNGETYTWSKHHQFLKFIDLPRQTKQPLELALACEDIEALHQAKELLKSHGWQAVDAVTLSSDIFPYRDYVLGSGGEFTVAKDQYSRLRTGWFSDRSACYLAAAKPVITQDTGFGNILPTGEGLFAFQNMEDIIAAFDAINSAYEHHSRAAQAIAKEFFKAETVLSKLIVDLGF